MLVESSSLFPEHIMRIPYDQWNRFTEKNLHAREAGKLQLKLVEALRRREGREVIAVDMGGDKFSWAHLVAEGDHLEFVAPPEKFNSTHGAGYLDLLLEVGHKAEAMGVPVAISYAGPLDGTRPQDGPNVRQFVADVQDRLGGDLSSITPFVRNDAIAGLTAAVLYAQTNNPQVENIVYIICGSGLGTAAYRRGEMIAAEGGHIALSPALNLFDMQQACGVFGQEFTCLERVGSSKAGVEALWAELAPAVQGEFSTEANLTGLDISKEFQKGHPIARQLYDLSAHIVAFTALGVANAEQIRFEGASQIALHGGIFSVPGYVERVQQIMAHYTGLTIPAFATHEFTSNACLLGAGLTGILSQRTNVRRIQS